MSFQVKQFRKLVKRVLKKLEPEVKYSDAAVELLMLTAAQESHLGRYLKQINGPALGIFQMEPVTDGDIWKSFLTYRPSMEKKVIDFTSFDTDIHETLDLIGNLNYQIVMARIHYYRVPYPLPDVNDINGLASYWKKYYNTPKGRGTIEEAIVNYGKYGQI